MIYNDEDCGFRMIVPQNEQNKIREKVKIYKQLVANTNRYLVEFIFPSINKKYHDPYLPKNMKGYVSIIRISCIPREESNYIESEL
ncbi:MAG: hypothetical protein LBI53_06470 [Candidatus Peribacteria bacterium]|jgi:hypothetical protein|nr:hypothetical protein [Candidatus Peribacteria bacterium]